MVRCQVVDNKKSLKQSSFGKYPVHVITKLWTLFKGKASPSTGSGNCRAQGQGGLPLFTCPALDPTGWLAVSSDPCRRKEGKEGQTALQISLLVYRADAQAACSAHGWTLLDMPQSTCSGWSLTIPPNISGPLLAGKQLLPTHRLLFSALAWLTHHTRSLKS